jgi:GNAT superfamily N-acetyltransferase
VIGERQDPGWRIAPARADDVADIAAMIRALADYERLSHLCVVTEETLRDALFAPDAAAEVLLARDAGAPAGFALFFPTFSTFLGRRGMWLEDLFVYPAFRGRGIGGALLRAVAAIAAERRCGRFEWAVLDWNTPAIAFYASLGATVMPDWRIARLVGPALSRLAQPSCGGADS